MTKIQLERGDYFQMKSLILTHQLAKQVAEAKLADLVKAHGGDPTLTYSLDDATLSLVAQ